MQSRVFLTILLVILAFRVMAGGIDWNSNIEDALQKAKEEDKHVFVFFTGSDWCSWCHKLTDEVFDHDEFREYVKDNMVMVELDFPRGEGLLSAEQKSYNQSKQQEYNIQGYPTVLILDETGKVVIQTGYQEGGPVKYVKFLEESLNWEFDDSNSTWIDPQGLTWQKNLENALDQAQKDDKYIFVNFTGSDWCVWCQRLTDEVFSKPEFAEFAREELVLVRFDFPKSQNQAAGEKNYNRKMLQSYGVKGFPTLFLMNAEGKVVEKLGYEKGGAVPYTDMLRDLIVSNR